MSENYPEPISFEVDAVRVAIVGARFNGNHVDALLKNTKETLRESGVGPAAIEVFRVPGSQELPFAAHKLSRLIDFDVIICLGVVIAGETNHHDVIGYGTAGAFHEVSRDANLPIINGVIVVNSESEASDRCSGSKNRGAEFARAALEMVEFDINTSNRLEENEEDFFDAMLDDWDEEDS